MISLLECSLAGRRIDVEIADGSLLARLHGHSRSGTERERTTCNYGLNPAVQDIASMNGMRVSGVDGTGEVRAIERPDHPFFLATLYQPQLGSEPGAPHPVFVGFVEAAARRAELVS